MLLALLSGQRGQTIHTLKSEDVRLKDYRCVLVFSAVLKQTKPGSHIQPSELEAFENKKLVYSCPHETVLEGYSGSEEREATLYFICQTLQ